MNDKHKRIISIRLYRSPCWDLVLEKFAKVHFIFAYTNICYVYYFLFFSCLLTQYVHKFLLYGMFTTMS